MNPERKEYKRISKPGIVLYLEDWADYLETFSPEEIFSLLEALIKFQMKEEITTFEDSGLKIAYKHSMQTNYVDSLNYARKQARSRRMNHIKSHKAEYDKGKPKPTLREFVDTLQEDDELRKFLEGEKLDKEDDD